MSLKVKTFLDSIFNFFCFLFAGHILYKLLTLCSKASLRMDLRTVVACFMSVLAICHASGQFQVYEAEYNHLYSVTEDKDGLESIRALHQQVINQQVLIH